MAWRSGAPAVWGPQKEHQKTILIWILPQAGVVGPATGFSLTVLPISYMASIGGNLPIPIAGNLVTDVNIGVNPNYLIPRYVYKTEVPKLNFASGVMAPFNWLDVTGWFRWGIFRQAAPIANAGFSDHRLRDLLQESDDQIAAAE